MKTNRFGLAVVAAGMVALASVVLNASDPVGVYCVVNKVVLTPDEQKPTAVQIWGACALPIGGRTDEGTYTMGWYAPPQPGYLYYSLPAGKEALALREWTDLRMAAGTGDVVAFGGRYMKVGRMRRADEKPAAPDVYPIQLGVVKMKAPANRDEPGFSYTDLFAALRRTAGVK